MKTRKKIRWRRVSKTSARASKLKRRVWRRRDYYTVECSYKGFDGAVDSQLEEIAGVESSSSGMSFIDGYRDISFDFKSRDDALIAVLRFKSARVRSLKVTTIFREQR